MKKIMISCAALVALGSSMFAADGEAIFKKCAACHGAKAEKAYLNKVAVLTSVDKEARLADMKAYKEGTLGDGKGKIGMGGVMKGQMATLSDEDMVAVNEYIETLK